MLSNRVTLTGHLGSDPKVLSSATGEIFTSARLAVTNRYTNRSGSTVDDTQWFNVVAFGRRAERMLTQLHRGDRVCIEGRLTIRSYETEKGERRQTVQIVVTAFERLPKLSERRLALVELLAEAESSAARDSILDAAATEPQASAKTASASAKTTPASAKTAPASAKAKAAPAAKRSRKVAQA